MSTVKSIIAFVIAPVFIVIGAQITTGTRLTKLIYWAISFVFLALWLVAKEAYSPIEPPGILARLGLWSIISAITSAAISEIEYVFNQKNSA